MKNYLVLLLLLTGCGREVSLEAESMEWRSSVITEESPDTIQTVAGGVVFGDIDPFGSSEDLHNMSYAKGFYVSIILSNSGTGEKWRCLTGGTSDWETERAMATMFVRKGDRLIGKVDENGPRLWGIPGIKSIMCGILEEGVLDK